MSRHRRRSSAKLSFSLFSLIALLALAVVPAVAQAECTESGCAQYKVEIPESGAGSNHKPKNSNPEGGGTEPKAQASNQPKANGEGTPKSEPEGESEGKEKHGQGVAGNGGNNGGGNNSGNGASSSNAGKGNEGLGGEQPVSTETAKPVSHSSGGSSPLVPILIAIAVLAAISIGAVIYRQRRQGDGGSGSPVSPNAG